MGELLTKLGIDGRLLLAQIINFLVLLFILYKVLYKPVLKMLDERQTKIEASLKHAEQIEKNLFESHGEKQKILSEARNEAGKIIAESKEVAEKLRNDLTCKAKEDVANILEQGKHQLKTEKEIMFKELKNEIADMVTIATEKILKERVNIKVDRNTIEKNLDNLK